MNKKIYEISGAWFRMKDDFTLEEAENIQNLFNGMYEEGNNSTAYIKKFLAAVLQPVDMLLDLSGIDFGKTREPVAMDVIKDFFLLRLKSTAAITEYLDGLMKEFSPSSQI
jgi:hypothetical protein